MIDVSIAIDQESVTVVHKSRADGTYDAGGNAVPGASNPDVDIQAAIQPVSGKMLQDLPEGVRDQTKYVAWTRSTVDLGDTLVYIGQNYRVLHIWPRPIDEFIKLAIGEEHD